MELEAVKDAGAFRVHAIEVGPLAVNCYLVAHQATRKVVVIDPGDDGHMILSQIKDLALSVDKILLTHGHFDHVGAVAMLKNRTGANVYLHEEDVPKIKTARRQGLMFGLSVPDAPPPDILVADGDLVTFGEDAFRVAHTPGHTPGCVSYIMKKMAFVGDLIFAGSIGRTDLPGGDHEGLIRAVKEKIFVLPEETVLYPGHGPPTTVGEEKRTNPFFTGGW